MLVRTQTVLLLLLLLLFLPTSFGEASRPKKTTIPPENCTTEVTRKAYCT